MDNRRSAITDLTRVVLDFSVLFCVPLNLGFIIKVEQSDESQEGESVTSERIVRIDLVLCWKHEHFDVSRLARRIGTI